MNKKMAYICFLAIAALTASDSYVESSRHAGMKDLLAGCYFQNASIVGNGSTPRSEFLFLSKTLENDKTFIKDSFEANDLIYSFFYRQHNNSTEVVLLPILDKTSRFFTSQSFDQFARYQVGEGTKVRQLTMDALSYLYNRFNQNVIVHFLNHETSKKENNIPSRYTKLGRFFSYFANISDELAAHITYVKIQLSENEKKATLFDPISHCVGSRYFKNIYENKKIRYQDLSFSNGENILMQYVYRSDQCYNLHDCGRFSAIYLLSAINKKNIETLSLFDVYKGFKQWIESKDGLLTHQRKIDSKKINDLKDELFKEHNDELRKINQECTSHSETFSNIEKMEEDILEENSMLRSQMTPENGEFISDLISKNISKLVLLDEEMQKYISEKNEKIALELKALTLKMQNQTRKSIEKGLELEEQSPPMTKTWVAFSTTPMRKIIDLFLSFYN